MKRKNMNRLLAGFAALVLMFSTFGNSYNTIAAHADEAGPEQTAEETVMPSEEAAAEPAASDPAVEEVTAASDPAAVEAPAPAEVAAASDPVAMEAPAPAEPTEENPVAEEAVSGTIDPETTPLAEVPAEEKPAAVNVVIRYAVSPGDAGTVSNTEETIDISSADSSVKGSEAAANSGYEFVSWTDGDGNEVSQDAAFIPGKPGDGSNTEITYTANFRQEDEAAAEEPAAVTRMVKIIYTAGEGGSVDNSGCELDLNRKDSEVRGSVASPDEGYEFVNWTDAAGTEVAGADSPSYTPSRDSLTEGSCTYTANFRQKEVKKEVKEITIRYIAGEGGRVSAESETVDISKDGAVFRGATAMAGDGYDFAGWTENDENGKVVSTDRTLVPTDVTKDTTYCANFTEQRKSVEITGSAVSDGVTVHVSAPVGAFPGGTTLRISRVSSSGIDSAVQEAMGNGGMTGTVAFDITFTDENGNEIQPADGYTVSVTFDVSPGSSIVNDNSDEMQIFHMEDQNSSADKLSGAVPVDTGSTTSLSVQADSFSIYVVGVNAKNTITYDFYNGTDVVFTRIVKEGDTLNRPETPEMAGKTFAGWFYPDGTTEFTAFGTVPAVSATATVNLYAKFTEGNYVFYKESASDDSRTMYTEKVAAGNPVDLTKTITVATDKAAVGWVTVKTSSTPLTSLTMGAENIILYPVIRDAHWITYVSNGGTYVDAAYVLTGNSTVEPVKPVRTGYSFAGWYTDDTLTHKFTFGSALAENIILYARWTAAAASIKIIYWKETLTSGIYDYAETVPKDNITTGTVLSTAAYKKNYPYFHYSESASDQNVVVKGDGSTVLNIRYARNSYVFDFALNAGSTFSGATMTIAGNTYTNSGPHYSFTAKYGEDVSAKWPTASNMNKVNSVDYAKYFEGWAGGNTTSLFSSMRWNVTPEMIKTDTEQATQYYTGYWKTDLKQVALHYWVQNTDDNNYSELAGYAQKANTSGSFSAKDIAGFTYDHDNDYYDSSISTYVYNFYYLRNTYSLSFYNYSNTAEKTVAGIRFGAGIAAQNYVPARPSGVPAYCTFADWYTSSDCTAGTEYSFAGASMPASNLALYAKWTPGTIQVSFDLDGGTAPVPTGGQTGTGQQTISAGTTAAMPTVPVTKTGYTFSGWTRNAAAFNFNTALISDTVLKALWVSTSHYNVTYNKNSDSASGTVPTDANNYINGARAEVAGGSGLTWAAHAFVCWNTQADGSGTDYYPGAALTIGTGNVTLYARWTDKNTSTSYTLKYNGGTDAGHQTENTITVGLANSIVSIPSLASLGVTRENYIFTGWLTEDGRSVSDGGSIQVTSDNSSSNILTAQWKARIGITVTAESITRVYNGTALTGGFGITSGALAAGDILSSGTTGSITNAGSVANVLGRVIIRRNGTDVTNEYMITPQNGILTVLRKPVTVTANDRSKVYGTTDPVLDATVAGTLGSDTVAYTLSRATGENVGTYAITPAGEADQGNYSVTYFPGTLTITKAPAEQNTVTATSYSGIYDAVAHTITASAAQPGSTLYYSTDNVIWSTAAPVWTDVTAAQMVYVKAVNPNYEDAFGSATVTITAKPVTVTANNKSKVYGTTDPVLDATVAGTLGSDTVAYTLSRAAGENVGTYAITPAGDAAQGNYSVTYGTGTLKIVPSTSNAVTATPYSGIYDAAPHTITASAAQPGSTLYYSTDNVIWSTAAPAWTNITTAKTVYVKAVNPNYEDATGSATVTITAKPVTVTANNKSKVYGTTDPVLDAAVTGTLGSDTVAYTLSRATGENVGTYAITPAGEADQGNYSVTYFPGTLTITKAPAEQNTVTATSYSGIYDAVAHTITASAAQAGSTLYYSTDNATWSTAVPAWTDVTAAQTVYVKAVNPNYEDATGSATVTITAKPVTVTANNKSKVYGTTDPVLDAAVTGTLGSDTVAYTLSRATGENVGTYAITPAGDADQGNYSVTYFPGTLTITKAPAEQNTVTATSYSGIYDTVAHTITASAAQSGSTLYYSTDNVIWSTAAPAWTDVTAAETVYVKAENPNYEDAFGQAAVTITPAQLTVTTPSASKTYDGIALSAAGSISGLAAGETVTFVTTGIQLNVGSSVNTYTLTWDGTAKQGNYMVSASLGTLTVNEAGGGGGGGGGGGETPTVTTETVTTPGRVLGVTRLPDVPAPVQEEKPGSVLGAVRNVVQTGDSSEMVIWGTLFATALTILAVWFRKKHTGEEADT
jgi:uncharacterized repeat protein (TIGR02543 family)